MPWEKQYDPDAVQERAMRLFWSKGFAATSVADLVAATGINRASLYAAYRDKRALYIAALKRYDRRHRADFLYGIAARNDARDTVVAVFRAHAEADPALPSGCLLVHAAAELAPHDAEIGAFVARAFEEIETFFLEMIVRAQDEGAVARRVEPATAARALLALYLGQRAVARTGAGAAMADALAAEAGRLLPA